MNRPLNAREFLTPQAGGVTERQAAYFNAMAREVIRTGQVYYAVVELGPDFILYAALARVRRSPEMLLWRGFKNGNVARFKGAEWRYDNMYNAVTAFPELVQVIWQRQGWPEKMSPRIPEN